MPSPVMQHENKIENVLTLNSSECSNKYFVYLTKILLLMTYRQNYNLKLMIQSVNMKSLCNSMFIVTILL